MPEKKVRKSPFEIDEKAIVRLRKRLLIVKTELTQDAVDNTLNSAYFEKLGHEYKKMNACLDEVLKFLDLDLPDPPEQSDE